MQYFNLLCKVSFTLSILNLTIVKLNQTNSYLRYALQTGWNLIAKGDILMEKYKF